VTFTLVALTRLASPQLSSRRASGFVQTGFSDMCLQVGFSACVQVKAGAFSRR
jgi:hypothetical protein